MKLSKIKIGKRRSQRNGTKLLRLNNKWRKRIDNKMMSKNLFIHIVSFIFLYLNYI